MILLIQLALLLVFTLGGGYYAYRIAFYNPSADPDSVPDLNGSIYKPYHREITRLYRQIRDRECEFVTVFSEDGLKLTGRYYHIRDGAPLDIGFHGYRSRSFTDFAGGSEISLEMGHNLLLVDQRAHGHSEGRSISFGIRERWDVLSWVDYSLERFGVDTQIMLYGVSMGAATVLMASGSELPKNVKGIIADCPYAKPMDIILHVGRSNPLPQWLIRFFVIIGAKVFGGFDIRETDAVKAVARTKIPILILHGEADSFVPARMSRQVADANPELVLYETFPNAGHALSYLSDTLRYKSIIRTFTEKVLN